MLSAEHDRLERKAKVCQFLLLQECRGLDEFVYPVQHSMNSEKDTYIYIYIYNYI